MIKDKKLLHNYNNIKDYDYDEIITIILNFYSEEEIINLLRDKEFINKIPSYYLELIINNISFTSAFNMLQNEIILNKVNNICIRLTPKENLFINDCLSLNDIVNKLDHAMLKNMLLNSNRDYVINYLSSKYIINKLTNDDIIDIAILKNINLINDINYINKLSKNEIIKYINGILQKNINYDLLNNTHVKKIFYDVDYDIDEVIYLYDLLSTKTNHNIKDVDNSISSYRSVIFIYKIFGLKFSMTLLDDINIGLNDITNLFKNVDLNRISITKDLILFIKKYYKDVLNHKYDGLIIDFSTIINNYKEIYNQYDNLYTIEKELLKELNIDTNNLSNSTLKNIINNEYDSNIKNRINKINRNNKDYINFKGIYKEYTYETITNEEQLLSNIENDHVIKITHNNNIHYISLKFVNNIIYIKDNNLEDLSDVIKEIANKLLSDSINYVILDSDKNIDGIRLYNNFVLISYNQNITKSLLNAEQVNKKQSR
ncbi:MAG: hypothetical protein IJ572_01665 [Bacilli bacterium]|nr:hypothetical protein [Bacilli bacterium]